MRLFKCIEKSSYKHANNCENKVYDVQVDDTNIKFGNFFKVI